MLSADLTLKWGGVNWIKFESDSQTALWYPVPSVPFPKVKLVEVLDEMIRLRDAVAPPEEFKEVLEVEIEWTPDELEIELNQWEVKYKRDNGTITQETTIQAQLSLYEISYLIRNLRAWITGI